MSYQQAYINGFVKRASEYGYSTEQAVAILDKSASLGSTLGNFGEALFSAKDKFGDRFKDLQESDHYNDKIKELVSMGVPSHIADYGMKNIGEQNFGKGIRDLLVDKYNSDVFAKEHPILDSVADKTKDWLAKHNFDPETGALALGGAGLLGGGYLLGKHLNKKKEHHPQYSQY